MPQRPRTLATNAAAFFSALLLLGGIGLVWLGCTALQTRQWGVLAILDATFLFVGSVVSLMYLVVRLPAAWTGAVVFLLVSIAASGLLAVQGTAFGVHAVAMPVILALFSLAAFFCMVSLRPPPQYDILKKPWTLAMYARALFLLPLLLLAGTGLLWLGAGAFSDVKSAVGTARLWGVVAIVDAMFLLMGNVASVVYLVARLRAAWSGAVVSLLVSIASSGLLVVLVIASFPEIRRHGCVFAGMQIAIAQVSCVVLVILALLTLAAFFWVVSIRPQRR